MQVPGTPVCLLSADTDPDPRDLERAADLVYQSFAEYYDLFAASKSALLETIGRQFHEPHSEVGNTKVLRENGVVAAAYSWYPGEDSTERQLISLRMLLDVAEPRRDVLARLQTYRGQVHAVAEDSLYLARIAVAEHRRGAGLGQRLLSDFEAEARARGRKAASLHVRSSNLPAIRFYRAAGYHTVSPPDLAYCTMQKLLSMAPPMRERRAELQSAPQTAN